MSKRQSVIDYKNRVSKYIDLSDIKTKDDLLKAVETWQRKELTQKQINILTGSTGLYEDIKPKIKIKEIPEEKKSIIIEQTAILKRKPRKKDDMFYYGKIQDYVYKGKTKKAVLIIPKKFKKEQVRDIKTGKILGWV